MDPGDLPYAEAAVLCMFEDPDVLDIPHWFSLLACSFERWDLTSAEADEALIALKRKGLVELVGNSGLEPLADHRLFKLTRAGVGARRYLLPPNPRELAERYC